jgi:phthiocerol/phenolphthiocerol synthesis type-I polyketide synthase E
MGGTNVHAILEEAPPRRVDPIPARPHSVFTLSARCRHSLDENTQQLRRWLMDHPDADLTRVAATLQLGRKAFEYRRTLVCRDVPDALDALQAPSRMLTSQAQASRPVAFLFSGGGAQYAGMSSDLYRTEPRFARSVDECVQLLQPALGAEVRALLLATRDDARAMERLQDPEVMFPALFTVQYAMARLLQAHGVQPAYMVGHSHGEYVAACLAGVMDVATALELVAARAKLMMTMASGAMLAVPLSEADVSPLLEGTSLSVAAENSPRNTVVAGARREMEALRDRLRSMHGVAAKEVHINAGLHSALTEQIRAEFVARVARCTLRPPTIPYVSTVTGEWITAAEATDPAYWGRHLRQTVRFRRALLTLMQRQQPVLLDLGAGQVAGALARQNAAEGGWSVVSASRGVDEPRDDYECFVDALGRLWMLGCSVAWGGLYAGKRPALLELPTYAFQRKRYWIDPPEDARLRAPQATPTDEEATDVDAALLPDRPALMHEYVAPANECEQRIAAIWRKFLGFERIGVHDNFIELGGTSLLAAEVTTALKQTFAIDLALSAFLKAGTIHALAIEIETLAVQRDLDAQAELLSMIENLSPAEVAEMLEPDAGEYAASTATHA